MNHADDADQGTPATSSTRWDPIPPRVTGISGRPSQGRTTFAAIRRWKPSSTARRVRTRTLGTVLFGAILLFAWSAPGDEGWLASKRTALRECEFEFIRAQSDVPSVPGLSLSHTVYGMTEFEGMGAGGEDVSFRSQNTSFYAVAPLHIGRRSLALAVPVFSHTRFDMKKGGLDDAEVDSFYLPAGVAWQQRRGLQWAVFGMPSIHSALTDGGDPAMDYMGGILGRHLTGDRTTWYYGLVYDYSFGSNFIYPYVGYSYTADPAWTVGLVLPFPTVNYAPTKRFFAQLGVTPSGANFATRRDGNDVQAIGSFGGWDAGISGNVRLTGSLWMRVAAGVSGLRSLRVDDAGEVLFEQKLEQEPFVTLGFSIRP